MVRKKVSGKECSLKRWHANQWHIHRFWCWTWTKLWSTPTMTGLCGRQSNLARLQISYSRSCSFTLLGSIFHTISCYYALWLSVIMNHWEAQWLIQTLDYFWLNWHFSGHLTRSHELEIFQKNWRNKPSILQVTIDRHPVRFFVHKRPHVDFFLSVVRNLG